MSERRRSDGFLQRFRDGLPARAAQERVRREFELIGGNASYNTADIVFVAEQRTRYGQALTGEFIRTHARKGDIVLVAGVTAGERVEANDPQQRGYHFPERVSVFGWDNAFLDFTRVMRELPQRIFVLGGIGHFTHDPQLRDILEKDSYMAICPRRGLSGARQLQKPKTRPSGLVAVG
jgi:hypothetical protein